MFFLWSGAAISLAEIMTGSLIVPLGLKKGIAVILTGHLIGCLILALTGLIGFQKNTSALKSSRLAFGRYGSYAVSVFNIVQLIGWTAVMLIQCANSIRAIAGSPAGRLFFMALVLGVGALVAVWVLFADKGLQLINSAAVALLFLLCLVIIGLILGFRHMASAASGTISTGAALELSIVMPLSWLPLISDYTMNAKSKKSCFWGSFLGYFAGSSFMYIIGLAAVLFTKSQDITGAILHLGIGAAGLVVVVLATVTTTYLDVYSAVMSTLNILPRAPKRLLILIITAAGTLAAMFFPIGQYQNFLYAIGSIFAPVFSVVLVDYFLLRADHSATRINWAAILSAAVGTFAYYVFLRLDWVLGSTVPSMIIAAAAYLAAGSIPGRLGAAPETQAEKKA
ncbi:MAG: putative hydroxymethylpyrimidine transporter CytX [Clostridia bacterium]|nr:putative hydroxymethylpyrimidine transporter CytX [Clostridia bacterium]MDR3645329.1 putative hydroxymethylpyrimidine transporter CytX [Clostridia bacterium]